MEGSTNAVLEVRQELMVSPTGGNPTRRIAHFLKPSLKSIQDPPTELLPHSLFSQTPVAKLEKLPLEVKLNGWLHPQEDWIAWEERLHSKYQTLWRNAGIYEAIKASKCQIIRNQDLVIGLANKWYSKTNTFIFPWGEATITLEDVMVCGGYSVLGSPVFGLLETQELMGIEEKLIEVRRKLTKTKAKKCSDYAWMMYFLENDSELEHEGFLSLWLSRFVFPSNACNTISEHVFPVAIKLARGIRIALAPAVLATIYRDLGLLKKNITAAMAWGSDMDDEDHIALSLWAPFQLVQIWALERFPALQPEPNIIEGNQPRSLKWHKVKITKNDNVSLALDSAGNCFQWRPYSKSSSFKFYSETERWVCLSCDSDEELQSFARCLRHSQLVGIECIEQYLPHRVAMQFGMDQDIPGIVDCRKKSSLNAWKYYKKPMTGTKLYIGSCTFKPNVTSKYLDWWKQSKFGVDDPRKGSDSEHLVISISSSEDLSQAPFGEVQLEDSLGSLPGFPPKHLEDLSGDSDQEDKLTIKELLNLHGSHRSFEDEAVGNGTALSSNQSGVLHASVAVEEIAESITSEVENSAEEEDVIRGSKRPQVHTKSEDEVKKSVRAKQGAKNEDLIRGSKRHREDTNSEDVVGGSKCVKKDASRGNAKSPFCDTNGRDVTVGPKNVKENESESKIRSPFCDSFGVNDEEREGTVQCRVDIAGISQIEAFIGKLERVVSKLKAAKCGYKLDDIGAKAGL